jgi:H+/Cl- antiporter ClcA
MVFVAVIAVADYFYNRDKYLIFVGVFAVLIGTFCFWGFFFTKQFDKNAKFRRYIWLFSGVVWLYLAGRDITAYLHFHHETDYVVSSIFDISCSILSFWAFFSKSVYGKGHGVFPAARRRLMRLIMAIRMKVSLEAGSCS